MADAGNRIYASDNNRFNSPIVGFGLRTTSGTYTAGTERGYLRVDDVPIVAGESYSIWTTPLILESTVAADLVQVLIRVSTSGAATTSSQQLTLLAGPSKSASAAQNTTPMQVLYTPGVTGVVSVLMSYIRASGTGNVRINASVDIPAQLVIERKYTAPTDTGVDL